MLSVLPEPSRTAVGTAAFTGLRAGEICGLTWDAYDPADGNNEDSLGVVRVLRSVWRGRVGEPKNSRSKSTVPLIPQLQALLEQHVKQAETRHRGLSLQTVWGTLLILIACIVAR